MAHQMLETPTLSELLRHVFDATIRRRGNKYAKEKRVSIVDHGPTYVVAQVRGTEIYQSSLSFDGPELTVNLACTCPYYADRGPCKHLWATIIAAENAALLTTDEIMAAADMPDDGDFREPDFDDRAYFGPRPTDLRAPPPPQQTWRNQIHALQHAAAHLRKNRGIGSHEIHYVLGTPDALRGRNGVEIEVHSRRPRQNGKGWTRFKPLSLTDADIHELADPDDRRIMTLLTGAASAAPDYHMGYRPGTNYFNVSHALFDHLLPALAATKRFGWTLRGSEDTDWTPLMLDDGEPWLFRVNVTWDDDANSYRVVGMLTRGSEGMLLSEPMLVLASGWLFTRSTVARLDHGDAFSWICLLRGAGIMSVPKQDIGDWLVEVLGCRVRPPMTLPDELRWEEKLVQPVPQISIFRSEHPWNESRLGAVVSFRYGEAVFLHSEERHADYSPATRLLIRRDTDLEAELLDSLPQLGFRDPRYSYAHSYPQEVDFELPVRRLSKAAQALTAAGWEVEAQGARCRASGSVSMSVRSSGIDWFEVNGIVDFDGTEVPLPKILETLRAGDTMLRLDDGSFGILSEEWLRRYGLLTGMGSDLRFRSCQVALLDALLAAESNVTCDEAFRKARKELETFSSIEPEDPPAGFRGTLRAYQKEGLGWLTFLDRLGFGGCLADDMGLGKTVQALAMLEKGRDNGHGASLVVVPKSIVTNWMLEAERFAPGLKVLNHTQSGRPDSAEGLRGYDIVLTTYGTLRRDILWLRDIAFDWVILDEAQAIKNPATATAKSARLLTARRRLAMSGTPIENHLGELWSLFEFLNPGMLGASSLFSKAQAASDPEVDQDMRALLRSALRPFILRRTKERVASDLPAKVEDTVMCEMSGAQRKIYDELRDYYRKAIAAKIDESGLARNKIVVLEALLRLRQAACHPGLLDTARRRQSSAKLDLLLEQIDDVISEGHKMLVFSQFTSMLAIVRARLDSRGICYEYLDGRTRKRAARVERFQSDPECRLFLISLKAGGLGLNLTAADYVVLLDPWWNPAVEAQAIDRAHRIGQTRTVFAYRLVCKDTVEERILELQKTKRELADSIIAADNNLIRSLTREDLDLLLS